MGPDPLMRGRAAAALEAAWRSRDATQWLVLLADDVCVRSPLLASPFNGKQAARVVYEALIATFDSITVLDTWVRADSEVVAWQARVAGHEVSGIDVLRFNSDGLAYEVQVSIRPLAALAQFAAATGPHLARGRSRRAGIAAHLIMRPLPGVFALVDRLAPWLMPPLPPTAVASAPGGAERRSRGHAESG